MKLLAIHTGNNPDKHMLMVDLWRIARPVEQLKKHTDWDITERATIMKHLTEYKDKKDFTEAELEKTVEDLKQYDIIWGSYTSFMNGMVFALCKMVEDKHNVKIVIDLDDDLFAINPDNIGWWSKMSHEQTHEIQTIIRNNVYMTTTNEHLARRLRERGVANVYVAPNYISREYKSPRPDNGEEVVIGYFGGVSHYLDLHETPVIPVIEKIMHENKNVRFVTTGMTLEKYLPKGRSEYRDGKRGKAWITEIFPTLNYDISIGPLKLNMFNKGKSDIKWQESAMMYSAFVGTKIRPYLDTVQHGKDGLLVLNTFEDWYEALNKLVKSKDYRKTLADNAYTRVYNKMCIENNWQVYKDILEDIHAK